MRGIHTGYVVAIALAFLALGLLATAAVLRQEAAMEEAACRAANDGLAELSCMNFEGIRTNLMMLWSAGLFGAATLVGLATSWTTRRRIA